MADVHRLNPNGMLVLVGSVMYAIAGGPAIVAGGFAIGLLLVFLNRPDRERSDDEFPTSLFGTREPSSTHIRVVTAPRVGMVFAREALVVVPRRNVAAGL